MQFTLIGHSCLHVRTSAGSILIDPWLSGSCYWRSWWHYPPTEVDDSTLHPDHVYLTHHHFDHFHYPSMRRIDKAASVLIPRFGVDVMEGEVRSLGYEHVRELPHGEVVSLGHGVRVASYQYGIDDTAFVIADGDDIIVDINDCKIRGRALDQVLEEFGRPTFAMKAHSFAQSYPVGYSADDPADLGLIRRETFLEDFLGVMRELQPRYAVPFGSMVGFLHPESFHVNAALITPFEVRDYVEARGGFAIKGGFGVSWTHGEVVPMIPGDSWSSDGGFVLSDKDWYTARDEHLARLAAEVRPRIEAALAEEATRTLEWGDFERYMRRFLAALPPLTGRFLIKRPIVFEVASDESTPYWVVDVRHRRVRRLASPPADRADIIRVPEAILHDAIRDDILGVVHGGMRIRTELVAGGASADLAFWGLVAVRELGYLPSPWWSAARPGGVWLNRRMLGAMWARRREFADVVASLRGEGTMLERMSTGFGSDATDDLDAA